MRSTFEELSRRRVLKVAAVYVAIAWGATEMLGFLLPALSFPSWTVTIVALLFILGFPVAMFLSWVFDMGADGIRRTSPASGRGKLTIVLALTFLVAASAGLFYLIYPGSPPAVTDQKRETFDPPDNSVAVLPFVNMSEDPENNYFGDGIAEELLHRLAGNAGLLVTARTSSFQFRDNLLDVREIGELLNVAKILEGSVRKSGNRIRVTVQLVSTRDGYHDWSETYDRELTDIFAIQDEIAQSVGDALATRLLVSVRGGVSPTGRTSGITDPRRYDDYLRARHLFLQGTAAGVAGSIAILEDLVSSNPEFPLAWMSLAEAYSMRPGDNKDKDDLVRNAAMKALALDPSIGTAHALIADVAMQNWQWNEAKKRFDRAVAVDPGNPGILRGYATLLAQTGRTRDAHDLLQRARARDPLSAATKIAMAKLSLTRGETSAALQQLPPSDRSAVTDPRADEIVVVALLRQHRFDEALSLVERGRHNDGEVRGFWPDFVIAAISSPQDRESASTRLEALVSSGEVSPKAALVYQVWLGNRDAAYTNSLQCLEKKNCPLEELWQAEFSEFRTDPRFAQFAVNAGLQRHWEEFGYPVYCSRRDGRLSCR